LDVFLPIEVGNPPCRHSLRDECRVLMVHGVLHTMGFDHEVDQREAKTMEMLEGKLLTNLQWQAKTLPYPPPPNLHHPIPPSTPWHHIMQLISTLSSPSPLRA